MLVLAETEPEEPWGGAGVAAVDRTAEAGTADPD